MPPLVQTLTRWLLCLATVTIAPAVAAAGDWTHAPYELGQGLHFPGRGLDIGGYLSLQYQNLHRQSAAFSAHDLSLFVAKRFTDRWSAFSEVELGDDLSVNQDGHVLHDPELDIERLYADYRAAPSATLRFGKFLTPVGRWNQIHADPLVWTVSRPLTTTAAFARHATGAMMYGTVAAAGHDLDYWFFADDTADLDPHERKEPAFESTDSTQQLTNNFNHGVGGRLLYHLFGGHFSIGASYLHFEMKRPDQDKNLYGADFYWTTRYAVLSGEAIYRTPRGSSQSDERGGFVQVVVPVPLRLYLVGRYEHYDTDALQAHPTLRVLGVTWRPEPPLSVKLEYRGGSNNSTVAPSGWFASLAVLF